ncbi:hypothetical protein OROHE_012137 [Orobanche hederae]
MDRDLLKPLEEIIQKFRETLEAENYRIDEQMMPIKHERELIRSNPGFKQYLCSLLLYVSKEYNNVSVDSGEIVELYIKEINLMEERLRNQLPAHLRNQVATEFKFVDRHPLFHSCVYADLLDLQRRMHDVYKAAKKSEKNRLKKVRRRNKASQEQEASVGPQNLGEADDGSEKVIVEAKEASVESEIEIKDEPSDGFDKQDVATEENLAKWLDLPQTCVPGRAFMQFSPGERTDYSTCIFKGKLTISDPSKTIDRDPISVMYFKMDESVYEMSGFPWADFSMRYPNENVLSVYGVGSTVDEQFFIACETLDQPFATWLENPKNFSSDEPLSCTLKSFFKDVIYGAMHVHNQSKGSLEADLSTHNIYICNGRAKMSLLRQRKPTPSMLNATATFCRMVRKEVYKSVPIPVELKHLLNHMEMNSWHLTCATHPLFFSASQLCMYAKVAFERIKAYPTKEMWKIFLLINYSVQENKVLKFPSVDWITRVEHAALLDVLNFNKNKIANTGAGKENDDGKTVEEAAERKVVGDEVKMVSYVESAWSFFEFYRNVVVHIKKGTLTHEEIVSEMNKIFPNFLLCVHEVLTRYHIFVTVGDDFTLEEGGGEDEECRSQLIPIYIEPEILHQHNLNKHLSRGCEG